MEENRQRKLENQKKAEVVQKVCTILTHSALYMYIYVSY